MILIKLLTRAVKQQQHHSYGQWPGRTKHEPRLQQERCTNACIYADSIAVLLLA